MTREAKFGISCFAVGISTAGCIMCALRGEVLPLLMNAAAGLFNLSLLARRSRSTPSLTTDAAHGRGERN